MDRASPKQFPELILASRSPRRRALLAEAGYQFRIVVPDESAEGGICSGELPTEYVARLARQKAQDVVRRIDEGIVLAADTIAECDGQVLGKPRDESHARQMLTLLRARLHYVHTGVCLWQVDSPDPVVCVSTTKLRMDAITDDQLDEYLESGGWEGKAGAFGYQDRLGWIHVIAGSESNVVGLPMETLKELLQKLLPE